MCVLRQLFIQIIQLKSLKHPDYNNYTMYVVKTKLERKNQPQKHEATNNC